MMHITELLVTAYDGNDAVFAVNLIPNEASVVLTSTNAKGEAVVDSAWQQATDAFTAVRELVEKLTSVPTLVP